MPDRYVRDALLTSTTWQQLTDAETQNLFIRLILIVDDFGCFDGRDEVIATNVYPTVCLAAEELEGISKMLRELHRTGMIIRYSNAGKPFIAITQWGNDLRGNRKFPAPPVDVDSDGVNHRGKFGKDIGWFNPPGFDLVSTLIGTDNRAVVPQPPEWRPAEHLKPNPKSKVGWRRQPAAPVTGSTTDAPQLHAASDTPPMTRSLSHAASDSALITGGSEKRIGGEEEVVAGVVVAGTGSGHTPPVTTSPSTPTNGGIIEYRQGRFVGLSEEQRVKWQAMFDELRIPDQIDRAAAWLEVHDDERGAIERQGLGFAQFIVRWLLREVRSPRTEAGS